MFIERQWAWPLRIRVAKLVGSDSTIAVIKPAVREEHAAVVYKLAIEQLVGSEECDAVCVNPLSGHRSHADYVRSAGQAAGARIVRDITTGPHSEFDLPAVYDAYLASLDKKVRQNLRRDLNQLIGKHGLKSEVVRAGEDVKAILPSFFEMHTAQWRAQNKLGHFGDWPGSEVFTRDLVESLAGCDGARIIRLWVDDQVAALELCLRHGSIWHWRLPARAAGEQWDKLGLGRIGMARMLEAAFADGASRVEGGPGHYDYKLKHGATEFQLQSITMARPQWLSVFRTRLHIRWATIIHFLYYRLWFIRIAARLPIKRRPLRQFWIRRRL
jgi:hypothetical protein